MSNNTAEAAEQIEMRELLTNISRQLNIVTERLDRQDQRIEEIGVRPQNQQANRHRRELQHPRRRLEFEEDEGEESVVDEMVSSDNRSDRGYYREQRGGRRNRRAPRERDDVDRNLGSIKFSIPSFQGKNDPDIYLDWEERMEFIFECHNYSEAKKVTLAAVEFSDYAASWWNQVRRERTRNGEPHISTWAEMKRVMRKRFVPNYYYRELYVRLQGLTQSSKSVEDYHKELEKALIRAGIHEDEEATMARFLCGLNRDIAAVVELQDYADLGELVSKAIRVEKQLKRTKSGRYETRHNQSSASNWRTQAEKKDDKMVVKPKDPFGTNRSTWEAKGKEVAATQPQRRRDIKCFRCHGIGHIASDCPNTRAMILLDSGDIVTEGEASDENDTLEEESEREYPVEGQTLVIQRTLNMQAEVEDGVNEQRDNLFHTRCHIKERVCHLIVDSGSCTNVASTLLVKKLDLPTTKHPRPYRLQWLNDCGEIKVTRQALIPFSIGKYKDKVLCDVVPMHASHILLGRPWQFDRKVIHDGYRNRYSLEWDSRKVTLMPMSPKDVYTDQLRLKQAHS